MGDICFNGRWASDYGITVERLPNRPMTKRQYSSTAVPGRTGNVLTSENYFSNVLQPYQIWIRPPYGDTMTDGGAARLAEWLYADDPFDGSDADGYFWIEDTYSRSVKRRAIVAEVSELETAWNKAGRCTVTFEEKPKKYNKDGLVFPDTPDSDTWMYLPGPYNAQPLVKLVMTYDEDNEVYLPCSVNFHNVLQDSRRPEVRVVVFNPPETDEPSDEMATIYIDCETCEIYSLIGGAKVNRMNRCYVEEPTTGAVSPCFPYLWGRNAANWIGINNCDAYVMRRDFNL